MIGITLAFVAFCFIAMFFLATKTLITSVTISVGVALVIAALWKTPDPVKQRNKQKLLVFGVLATQLILLPFACQQAKSTLFPDLTDYKAKRTEIFELFGREDIDNKFERGYAIAQSAQSAWEKRDLHNSVLEAFIYSKPEMHFSAVDLEQAQMAYERQQKAYGNTDLDPCKAEEPNAYPKIVANRDGPRSLEQFIERHPESIKGGCSELGSLMYLLEKKCRGAWQGRCKNEINREKLEAFADSSDSVVLRSDLKSFISEIWDKSK